MTPDRRVVEQRHLPLSPNDDNAGQSDPPWESATAVTSAYAARSSEYVELFGSIEAASEVDRAAVLDWSRTVTGPVLDVGCGPGQWTDFLARHGTDIEGIDPTPEFVAAAKQRYPSRRFRPGQAEDLGVAEESLGGVLAWYSLIHSDPAQVDAALAEFARALQPGAGLALGFFEGPDLAPFDHAVVTAYSWPIRALAARVEAAGFAVTTMQTRTVSAARRHGLILARRLTDLDC